MAARPARSCPVCNLPLSRSAGGAVPVEMRPKGDYISPIKRSVICAECSSWFETFLRPGVVANSAMPPDGEAGPATL